MKKEITQFPDEMRNKEDAMRAFLCLEDKMQLNRIENALEDVLDVVTEAERRGYERAMHGVQKASASSIMTLYPSVEPEPVLIIPRSFFDGQLTPPETSEV